MLEYNVFDYLLDSTFVVDSDGKVVYCNEAAATFCQTSVRRVVGKANISDYIQFSEPGLVPFNANSQGRTSPTALIETAYNLVKAGKSGKTQLTVRPAGDQHWVFFLHDVSLEETLAAKYRSELLQKEEYARNLEKLVEARTGELRSVNKTLNAILDSLGQGFFTFNAAGDCGGVFTKACEDILEGSPKERKAWEVLGVAEEKDRAQFQKWMETAFKEYLPFEDLKGLGPNLFAHKQNRHVVLDYFPIRREKNEISDIVVVATDKTAEFEAQLALETERQFASMIVKYLKNKEQFLQFLASVRVAIQNLLDLGAKPLVAAGIAESFRILHTLEGEAGTFSLRDLRQLSRDSQHFLEPFKSAKAVPAPAQHEYAESLRQLKSQYEKFLAENENIFGISSGESAKTLEVPASSVYAFAEELKSGPAALRTKYRDLFFSVTFESRLKYFDSLLQSVAEKLGKQVKPLVIEGGDIRIFPEPYQGFFASLVHAFRNAADHGLEEPTEREWAGKDPAGQIRVTIAREATGFKFIIADDGRGIDPAVIREKLQSKFPDKNFSAQSDEEIIQNVSLPGFSSRDSVGEFSGRGVGLDALREEVVSIGGTLHLKSIVGKGTSIEILIPELGSENTMQVRRSA
ncbi:MAG: ATP-binding protein [Bdellovibrionales bacterium]